MAINKAAFIRYQVLDNCFRNSAKKYFWEDLLEACNRKLEEIAPDTNGIQRRQLFDDIAFMESSDGWSIELLRHREGKKVYYRYADLNFSINNQPINAAEAGQIQSALQVLSRFKGLPQFGWVNELILKLEQSFGFKAEEEEIIAFDNNEYLKGIEFLGDLFNAIHYKKALHIDYQSFKTETPQPITLHPYYLKEYDNRWFLFGYNPQYESISNLALDRIIAIKEIRGKYIASKKINFKEYFEDIVGVSKSQNEELIRIELFFLPEQAPYILTKPLHGSQKIIHNDKKGLSISIEVIPNYELEKLILSFGDKCKVLGPKKFQRAIQERIKKVSALYC